MNVVCQHDGRLRRTRKQLKVISHKTYDQINRKRQCEDLLERPWMPTVIGHHYLPSNRPLTISLLAVRRTLTVPCYGH